jgi:protein-S-isoprenylcysteine O-methyltransferase Ste14
LALRRIAGPLFQENYEMKTFIEKYALAVVILAALGLIIEGDFFSLSPGVIIGQAIAILLILSSRAAFGRQSPAIGARPGEGGLVRRGPYRFIRHPMYTGALLLIWVSAFSHWSLINGGIALIVAAVTVTRISYEERLLQARYSDYAEYARHSKRFIPFVY